MSKPNTKSKGNRYDKSQYHIPYYTTSFFNPTRELENEETKFSTKHMIKLPIKITADGDESRSNVTTFKIKGTTDFNNNMEGVPETLPQLHEWVIKPKAIVDKYQEFRTALKLLHIICPNQSNLARNS